MTEILLDLRDKVNNLLFVLHLKHPGLHSKVVSEHPNFQMLIYDNVRHQC